MLTAARTSMPFLQSRHLTHRVQSVRLAWRKGRPVGAYVSVWCGTCLYVDPGRTQSRSHLVAEADTVCTRCEKSATAHGQPPTGLRETTAPRTTRLGPPAL